MRALARRGRRGATHQGFPVLDARGRLVGVRDAARPARPDASATVPACGAVVRRPPVVVYEDSTLRDAADQMVIEHVGRLPVVRRGADREVVGIVSRSDLLAAHAPRLEAAHRVRSARRLWPPRARAGPGG